MGERGWQTVGWAAAAIVAVLAATRLLDATPEPPPVRVGGAARSAEQGGGHGGGRAAARLVVHVAGAVRRPGLYRLRDGARVADAIERAGGPGTRAQLDLINIAARLRDGQQVVVPAAAGAGTGAGGGAPGGPGGAAAGVAASGAAAAEGGPPLSLGSATAEQLAALDGIGPTLAERIVALRTERGGFAAVADLADVEGIGEQRLAALEEALVP